MDRLVELTRYFPDYLRTYPEIQRTAEAEEKELGRLYNAVDALWNNGYIQTADYTGIKRWESLLGIQPYPGDSLEERRASVLLKWNQQLPYTLLRLKERLDATVKDAYELDVRPGVYKLEIRVIAQTYRVLCQTRNMIQNMIPANLIFILTGAYLECFPTDINVVSGMEISSAFYARYNRKFLHIDGTWLLNGIYKINGYKEIENLDLYPTALTIRGGWGTASKTKTSVSCTVQARADPQSQSALDVVSRTEVHKNNEIKLGILEASGVSLEAGSQLTVEKDLWYLDGAYILDGTKLLDAEIFYYSL